MSKPDKKLFLFDAMALIYRAHFAFSKNPRINSKGVNTGAALGFTNTLVEVINKEKPTHLAVCFDPPGKTFRHEAFEEYKAQREAMPEDIKIAIPKVKEIVEAFNIPVLEKEGFEADDVIGTISKKAAAEGFEVFMMTPDKDYAQLVQEHVYLYKPAYMGNAVTVMGIPEVLKKFDLDTVDQVRDLLGLQGDASDNIPGIPGIGPKTAVKLLKQFGTVEEIVANADQLKGKQKERVIEFGKQGIQSKELATIHTEVPVEYDVAKLKYDGPNEEKLQAIFEDLEFRTLMKRVLNVEKPKASAPGQPSLFDEPGAAEEVPTDRKTLETIPHEYTLADTEEKQQELIKTLSAQKEFCFDTETTGLQAFEAELVGISFSIEKHKGWYVPVSADQEKAKQQVEQFKPLFENPDILKIGQNLKYDMLVLRNYGIKLQGELFDTMLAHYLLEPENRHNMDALAENFLNYTPVSIESLIGKKGKKQGSMRDVELDKITEYATEDADITLQLKETFEPMILQENFSKLLHDVEAPLVSVLTSMEYEGVKVDTDTLKELSSTLGEESLKIQSRIFEIAGEEFNIGSPKQLGEILFGKLKLVDKPKKTKSGQYATGEEILSKLADKHEIAAMIMEFRELQKLKSTYVDALPTLISKKDGRIHTSYNQAVTATGRLSSTNPNLQNIPIRTEKGKLIRKAFVSRNEDYILMAADYSQIELRIMAAFAKDEDMIKAFKEGRDIHATTASKIFKVPLEEVDSDMRRKAKTANFGIIYGISAFGLSQRLSIPRKEAADIIEAYFTEFSAVKAYMDKVIKEAQEKEYVTTMLGRKRYLRDINSRNATIRGFAERNAINTPIQGSAADMIKMAMIDVYKWMEKENLKSKMILQVHDELVFDVHKDEVELMKEKVEELMKNALPIEVPMEVGIDIGDNWLDAH